MIRGLLLHGLPERPSASSTFMDPRLQMADIVAALATASAVLADSPIWTEPGRPVPALIELPQARPARRAFPLFSGPPNRLDPRRIGRANLVVNQSNHHGFAQFSHIISQFPEFIKNKILMP